jgi:D-alanyl-D-alanine carboxypeptidase
MSHPPRVALAAALGVAVLLPTPAVTQQQQQQQQQEPPRPSKAIVAQRVDSLVRATLAQPSGPASVGVMIVRGGDTLVHRAWGLADAASGRAASEGATYQLASTSKQFTAALVLGLVDRGALALGDTLGQHLTGLRPEWRPLTIEQLLNHTAGLQRDYRPPSRRTARVPVDTLVAWAARDTMAFAPGTRWGYSNTGYMLLGALVEKLHGKPYRDVLRDEIARPLGLTTLGWCTSPEQRATEVTGHTRSPGGALQVAEEWNTDLALGAGGLCASVGDLARWMLALHGGRVLSPASYAAMITPRGAAVQEGYGFGIRAQRTPWGTPLIGHTGGSSGFVAVSWWLPEDSLTVAMVQNTLPSASIFPSLAAIALGRSAAPAAAAAAAAPTSTDASAATQAPASLEAFVGFYEGPQAGVGLTVSLAGGTLRAGYGPEGRPDDTYPLVPESGTVYHVGRAGAPQTVTFTVGPDGRITGAIPRNGAAAAPRLRKVR